PGGAGDLAVEAGEIHQQGQDGQDGVAVFGKGGAIEGGVGDGPQVLIAPFRQLGDAPPGVEVVAGPLGKITGRGDVVVDQHLRTAKPGQPQVEVMAHGVMDQQQVAGTVVEQVDVPGTVPQFEGRAVAEDL